MSSSPYLLSPPLCCVLGANGETSDHSFLPRPTTTGETSDHSLLSWSTTTGCPASCPFLSCCLNLARTILFPLMPTKMAPFPLPNQQPLLPLLSVAVLIVVDEPFSSPSTDDHQLQPHLSFLLSFTPPKVLSFPHFSLSIAHRRPRQPLRRHRRPRRHSSPSFLGRQSSVTPSSLSLSPPFTASTPSI